MNWLIVEDALKNRAGHWWEYVSSFRSGLHALGHDVTVLAEKDAEDFISSLEGVHPVMPNSIWERMGDGAGRLTRYLRVPHHGFTTFRTMKKWLRQHPSPDVIFVPTVLVHHLIGWWRLYRSVLRHGDSRLLLFFPNTPLTFNDETGQPMLGQDPTARLFAWLIRQLADGVKSGQVVLGVETHNMRDALTETIGVPFTYLPHPVECNRGNHSDGSVGEPLHFGCYGAARHEKGSDLLQAAIRKHFENHPESKSTFSIQWLGDFEDTEGRRISPDTVLESDPRVNYIRSFFGDGGYDQQLGKTDVMLLPYREPYRFRVSRVVIEAMVRGIPVVATRQTTLWEQASQFGAGLPCELNDVQSLTDAIADIERQSKMRGSNDNVLATARARSASAIDHFSVKTFASELNAAFDR